jgi:hypothetical protein
MKNFASTTILTLLLCGSVFSQNQTAVDDDKAAIKKVVEDCYLQVVFGTKEIAELEKGFHADFNMYVLHQNQIDKRSREVWEQRLRKVRAENRQSKRHYTHDFKLIDVTDYTGLVKLEIYGDGKLEYTDYLTLYKFEDGWKIMTKLFTYHP